jgi:hypothetical protein
MKSRGKSSSGDHDTNEGYISDVPTIGSITASEVSQDLVTQTKELEKHFRDKYHLLRSAYEKRIKELSQVVQATCTNILSDELIMEMRGDKASSAFIPAHISEIIERHLDSERERFLHELVQKSTHMETELNNYKQGAAKLKAELHEFQKSSHTTEMQLKQQLQSTLTRLKDKIDECEKLKRVSEQKAYEVDVLEQSFQQSTRELAIIENIDQQTQKHRTEMQQQLIAVTKQRNILHEANAELKAQVKQAKEEQERCVEMLEQKTRDEEISKQRVQELIKEVEGILEQEANESSIAISTVNEKMKLFRNRLLQELNQQKRLNTMLNDELNKCKAVKEDSSRDFKRYTDEIGSLKDKLSQEQNKSAHLGQIISSLTQSNQEQKMANHTLESKYGQLAEKMSDMELQHKKEQHMLQEKVKLETIQSMEMHNRKMEQKTEVQRLQMQQEMQQITNSLLRQSLAASSAQDQGDQMLRASAENALARISQQSTTPSLNPLRDLESKIYHQNIILALQQEKDSLLQSHGQYQQELTSLKQQQAQHEGEVTRLRELLKTATNNIDKLKSMVQESRQMVIMQKEEMSSMEPRYDRHVRQLTAKLTESEIKYIHCHDQLKWTETALKEVKEAPLSIPDGFLLISIEKHDQQLKKLADLQNKYNKLQEEYAMIDKRRIELESANATLATVVSTMSMNTSQPATKQAKAVRTQASQEGAGHASLHAGEGLEDGWRSGIFSDQGTQSHLSCRSQYSTIQHVAVTSEDSDRASYRDVHIQAKPYMSAVGVNTNENPQLQEASEQLSQAVLEHKLVSSKLAHYQTQWTALNEDLQRERIRVVHYKEDKQRLQQLVYTLYSVYKPQLSSLRQCLLNIKCRYNQQEQQLRNECMSTLQRFRGEFAKIFDGLHGKQKQQIQSMRMQLSTAHSQELTVLEQKFIAQINSLNQKHSMELGKMHKELLIRAERAVNASLVPMSSSAIGDALDTSSSQSTTGVNGNLVSNTHVTSSTAVSSSGVGVQAFESVLKGVLQGLQEQETLSLIGSGQIQALAIAHKEPSLAANAAARAIISEELDKFVMKYISIQSK